MADQKIPDSVPEELKDYLTKLEARVRKLERKITENERAARRVAEKQGNLYGNL